MIIKIGFLLMLLMLMLITLSGSSVGATQSPPAAPGRCLSPAVADELAAKLIDHQFVFIGSTHRDVKIID
jgi:hypothetical protein